MSLWWLQHLNECTDGSDCWHTLLLLPYHHHTADVGSLPLNGTLALSQPHKLSKGKP